jgi:hypothetical protein
LHVVVEKYNAFQMTFRARALCPELLAVLTQHIDSALAYLRRGTPGPLGPTAEPATESSDPARLDYQVPPRAEKIRWWLDHDRRLPDVFYWASLTALKIRLIQAFIFSIFLAAA